MRFRSTIWRLSCRVAAIPRYPVTVNAGRPASDAKPGFTGIMGAEDDQSPILVQFCTIRQTALHGYRNRIAFPLRTMTSQSRMAGKVDDISDNCRAYSISSIARNPQGIGSAGKEWMMWNGPDVEPSSMVSIRHKISQEIQPLWSPY